MFTGTQEVFVLIIIAVLLFVLPKLVSRNQSRKSTELSFSASISRLSGRMRLAIIASILWPLSVAAYLKPWDSGGMDASLYIGIGPVILGWSIRWIVDGFRKRKY